MPDLHVGAQPPAPEGPVHHRETRIAVALPPEAAGGAGLHPQMQFQMAEEPVRTQLANSNGHRIPANAVVPVSTTNSSWSSAAPRGVPSVNSALERNSRPLRWPPSRAPQQVPRRPADCRS